MTQSWVRQAWPDNVNVDKNTIKQNLARNSIATYANNAAIAAISEADQQLQPELIWNQADNSQYFKVQRAPNANETDIIATTLNNLSYKKIVIPIPQASQSAITNIQKAAGPYGYKEISQSGNYAEANIEKNTLYAIIEETSTNGSRTIINLPLASSIGVNNVLIFKNFTNSSRYITLSPKTQDRIDTTARGTDKNFTIPRGEFIYIFPTTDTTWESHLNIGELFLDNSNLYNQLLNILQVSGSLNISGNDQTNRINIAGEDLNNIGLYTADTTTIRPDNLTFNLSTTDYGKLFLIPTSIPENSTINITIPNFAHEGSGFLFKNLAPYSVRITLETTRTRDVRFLTLREAVNPPDFFKSTGFNLSLRSGHILSCFYSQIEEIWVADNFGIFKTFGSLQIPKGLIISENATLERNISISTARQFVNTTLNIAPFSNKSYLDISSLDSGNYETQIAFVKVGRIKAKTQASSLTANITPATAYQVRAGSSSSDETHPFLGHRVVGSEDRLLIAFDNASEDPMPLKIDVLEYK